MLCVLVVLAFLSENEWEEAARNPRGHAGIAGAAHRQAVHVLDGHGIVEPDPGDQFSDESWIAHLSRVALHDVLEDGFNARFLDDDEQIDLIGLTWLGRDDNTLDDWPSIRAEAARSHPDRRDGTANYLMGEPLVRDFLEDALSKFGQSCEDFEINRL